MRKKYAYVDNSPIHGKGVFAKKKIRKGTFLGTYEGQPTRKDDTYVLWVDEEGTWVGIDGENELRWLNHSSRPNAEFDGADLFAIRTIQPDEEITFFYGPEWADVE